jgi:hypothetical protein
MTDASPVAPASPASPSTPRLWWLLQVALVAALFAMSWWAFNRLPPTIVLRTLFFGRHGQPVSAAQFAFGLPTIVAVFVIVHLLAAHWNVLVWPRKALSSRDAAAMWPLAIRMLTIGVAQFLVVHAFALAAALGWISEIVGLRGAGVAFGLGLAVAGNWLPLVTRRNSFVGYRLSVLYDDPDRWRNAQRIAGYCFVASGLLLALLFLVAPVIGTRLLLPVFVVTVLAPVLLARRTAGQHKSA